MWVNLLYLMLLQKQVQKQQTIHFAQPNVGVVDVPDERLKVLHEMYNSKKTTPASVSFVDIAGLVKGASRGEGLGNKFLSHIRQVDAVAHVVRCFASGDITHVEGSVDPIRDIEIINTELCFSRPWRFCRKTFR